MHVIGHDHKSIQAVAVAIKLAKGCDQRFATARVAQDTRTIFRVQPEFLLAR
jgi:hypothetical protein